MRIEKREIDFEDDRGTIMDIFVKDAYEHCVLIHSTKGAIRGNHFHRESLQSDFILTGRMQVYRMAADGSLIETFEVGEGSVIYWEKSEAHEFVALEDCTFLSFVKGPRGGEDYEEDTYRLEVPLHQQYEKGIIDRSIK